MQVAGGCSQLLPESELDPHVSLPRFAPHRSAVVGLDRGLFGTAGMPRSCIGQDFLKPVKPALNVLHMLSVALLFVSLVALYLNHHLIRSLVAL